MGGKSRGRGAAATFGLLLLLAGIAGGVVLWLMADRRPEQAVDGFARAPVGCTTTLEFADTGTFFVYEEVVGDGSDAFAVCDPVATPGADFAVELRFEDRAVALRDDTSISYDTGTAIGESVGRVEITEPGRYELAVEGSDAGVVAAVGRDPEADVDRYRLGAISVAAGGVLLGGLMLLLAGRRSRRAATFATPDGPGWGPTGPTAVPYTPPPAPPRLPDEPAPAWPPATPTVPGATDGTAPEVAAPTWAPPQAGERRDPPPPA